MTGMALRKFGMLNLPGRVSIRRSRDLSIQRTWNGAGSFQAWSLRLVFSALICFGAFC